MRNKYQVFNVQIDHEILTFLVYPKTYINIWRLTNITTGKLFNETVLGPIDTIKSSLSFKKNADLTLR